MRSAFPDATIVRPSKMFGSRDRFLNWVAYLGTTAPRLFPMVGDGEALIQPVHIEDVAEGIIRYYIIYHLLSSWHVIYKSL